MPLDSLAMRVGIQSSSVAYHLRRLEEAGLVHRRVVGRRRLTFPGQFRGNRKVEGFAILRHPTARRIASQLVASPGSDFSVIMSSTGVSSRALYHHLKRLKNAGLVDVESAWGYRDLRATQALAGLMASLESELSSRPAGRE